MTSIPLSDEDDLTQYHQLELSEMDKALERVELALENDTPQANDLIKEIIHKTRFKTHQAFQLRRAHGLRLLSRLNYRRMEFADAVGNAIESLSIYESFDDYWGIYRVSWLLGIYYNRLGDTVQAMETLLRALEFAEKIKDAQGIGSVSSMIGILNSNMGQYQQAIDQLSHSIKWMEKDNDTYGIATVYNNFARIYATMNDFDTAITYALQSIELSQKVGSEHLQITCEIALGDVYVQAGRYEEALSQFEKCLATCRKREWFDLEVATVSKVGAAHLGMANTEKAIEILKSGLEISKKNLSTYITIDILRTLIAAYEKQQAYQQGFECYQLLQELQDAQLTTERSARLYALEQSYQMKVARNEALLHQERAEAIEQQAKQDVEYFQQINQLRDEFLNAATHDLKNPLATIRTSAYLISQKVNASDVAVHVDMINRQVTRMENLIMDMLELAKLETGRALNLSESSIVSLISDVVQEHQHMAEQKRIDLIYTYNDFHTSISVSMDVSLMKRAISNLVSNAIKYSHHSSSVIIEINDMDTLVTITIMDNGIGIPEEDLPYIFDRFYRSQMAEQRDVEGTGLGLSIVKTIIEQHHGTITTESILNEGSTFIIHLPITHTF